MATALALPVPYISAQPTSRVLQVGVGCRYTTITDAITAAGTLTRTQANQVVIEVYPGVYTENITLPTFTSLVGHTTGRIGEVVITNLLNAATVTLPNTTGSFHFIKGILIRNTSDTNGTQCITQPDGAYAQMLYIYDCFLQKTVTAGATGNAFSLLNLGAHTGTTVIVDTQFLATDAVMAVLTFRGIEADGGSLTVKNCLMTITLTQIAGGGLAATGIGILASDQACSVHVDSTMFNLAGPVANVAHTLTGISALVAPAAGDYHTVTGNLINITGGGVNDGILHNTAGASTMYVTSNVINVALGTTDNGIRTAVLAVTTCSGDQIVATTARYSGVATTTSVVPGIVQPEVGYTSVVGNVNNGNGIAQVAITNDGNNNHNATFVGGILTVYV